MRWFFREDLVNDRGAIYIAAARAPQNEELVAAFYELRRKQALGIALSAQFISDTAVWCIIESPDDPREAEEMMLSPAQLKLSVASNLRDITESSQLPWYLRRIRVLLNPPIYPLPDVPSRTRLINAIA